MTTDLSTTKPVADPRWATNGGTRVAPSSGQMDTGWTNGQRPPFNVMNWLQGVIYDWQQWAEDSIDELDSDKLSRHGLNAFDGHLKPDADVTRDIGDGTHQVRTVYCDTLNISGEIDGSGVAFVGLNAADVQVDTLEAATSLQVASKTTLISDRITMTNTSDTKSTARAKAVNTRNTIKAAGRVLLNSGVYTMEEGFNVSATVTQVTNGGKNDIRVTFSTNFADTNYIVVAACENAVALAEIIVGSPLIATKNAAHVDFQFGKVSTAAHVDCDTLVTWISFIILGVQ